MNRKLRLKFLNKIAQTATPSVPTEQVAASKPIQPAPAISASDAYPNVRTGYTAAQMDVINSLVSKLNVATHIATGGTYNLQVLKNKAFTYDPSEFQSPDQKNLVNFFNKVFHGILNAGNAFPAPLNNQQLSAIVTPLIQAPELKNLSQVNPTGQIAQKIPGNLQQDIRNDLMRLLPTPVRAV